MSRNPFVVNYDSFGEGGLQMLAGAAGSIFAGRFAEQVYRSSSSTKVALPISTAVDYKKSNSRTMTKTLTKRRSNKKGRSKLATVAAVKRMIGTVVETKQAAVFPAQLAMGKGSIYSHNVTAQIIQGTADGQRAGDSISLTTLEYRASINTNKVGGFYQYRLLVLYTGEEVNAGANFGTSLAYTDIVVAPYTASQVFGIINTKACTVLHDRQIDINSVIQGEVDGATVVGNVNLKGLKFPYQTPGSVYGKTKNLMIVVIAKFISAATTQPTDCGDVIINYKMVYRDA